MKYEYEVIMLAGHNEEWRTQILSDRGREGWRLLQVDQGQAYLERAIDLKPLNSHPEGFKQWATKNNEIIARPPEGPSF